MSRVGILIETENGQVKEANFGPLTAACGQGDNELFALLLDADEATGIEALATYGAHKVVTVKAQGCDLAASADTQARALAEVMQHFEITALLALSSPIGRDILARLAALLDAPLILDCVDVDMANSTVKKSHFSGKTFATIKLPAERFICGVRPNAIEAVPSPAEAEVLPFSIQLEDPGLTQIKEVKKDKALKTDLTEANVIITGGRPIGSADNYKILQECADLLGAAVGASRAAVDAGYASYSMQVGQTGKTVSPRLYIGCGLSGSIQHFAGMKSSKVIVAINTDKDAPIFTKCDYGIVGDLFEVVPLLTEVLREEKG